MKIFKGCMALIAGLAMSSAVMAADLTLSGDVGVDSKNVYRGQELSDSVNYNGRLRVDNILLDGLFVEGSVSTINTSPLKNADARTEWNVGWHGQFDRLGVEVSVARVYTSKADYVNIHDFHVYNSFNYNEFRGKLSYQATDAFKVYGFVGQGFTNPDFDRDFDIRYYLGGQNTYFGVGAEAVVANGLTVGALTSAQRYDNISKTRYNNSELYASYNVWKGLELEGRYSFGGKSVLDTDISNVGYVGVRYRF